MTTRAFASGALLLAAFAVPAQAQLIGGRTFRVSTRPIRTGSPVVALTSTLEGNLVAAMREYRDNDEQVIAQRLDRWGHPVVPEIVVALPTHGGPRVAPTAGGGFVVVFLHTSGLQGRCFDRDGVGTPPFFIGPGFGPDVASDAAGNFVVAWAQGSGGEGPILAQRFSGSCVPVGPPAMVSPTADPLLNSGPAVAVGPDGRFVVTWEDPDGSFAGVFARRFAADGTPAGAAFLVNSGTAGQQIRQSASMAADGSFVIAWESELAGIFARRFDALGAPLGPDLAVQTATPFIFAPDVTHMVDGGFVVTWYENPADLRVALRGFDPAGTPGAVVTVGPAVNNLVGLALAAQSEGFVAVAWQRQDGPQGEYAVRRFGPLAAEAIAFDSVMEPGEDVVAAPGWRNGTGTTIALSGAATAFAGPSVPGAVYRLVDGAAWYGPLANGAASSCDVTGDCYLVGVSVPSARPAHWDAFLDETASWTGGTATHRWPVHVGASFTDVPPASPFYPFVETILHAAVTGGCGPEAYCPGSNVTREQLAVFVLRGRHDRYQAIPCGGFLEFDDVPAGSPFCGWIEDLVDRGVVRGCGPRTYCPTAPVTREQMAVFVLATKEGHGYAPPACGTPMFADVPASSPFCPWIEELARRGVVSGCGGGSYCPASAVTREQMAVFLTATFGLSLTLP
jgi:hypothetical protein